MFIVGPIEFCQALVPHELSCSNVKELGFSLICVEKIYKNLGMYS